MVPEYIADLIPPPVADTTQYSLKYNRNVGLHTTISQKSCIQSSI